MRSDNMQPRRNPARSTRRNGRFLDNKIWCTDDSIVQPRSLLRNTLAPFSAPMSCGTSKSDSTPKIGQPAVVKLKSPPAPVLKSKNVPTARISTSKSVPKSSRKTSVSTLQIGMPPGSTSEIIPAVPVSASKGVSAKPKKFQKEKKFIRFRFQIDCSAAVEVNVDKLVSFFKTDMKIEGKRNNLSQVTITRRNTNVDILAKVMLKKKYLKFLAKKFLRKEEIFRYRVAHKNNRAYKLVMKEIVQSKSRKGFVN